MAARGAVLGAGSAAPPADIPAPPPVGVRPHTHPLSSLRFAGYSTATGATGEPVPPTKGSGVADSRKL